MKTANPGRNIVCIITAAFILTGMVTARADDQKDLNSVVTNQTPEASPSVNSEWTHQTQSGYGNQPAPSLINGRSGLTFQSVEPYLDKKQAREVAWLGLGVDESADALSSQLGLKPGEGLTVNFIVTNSPAARAGFQKNDVLAELDGQMLVHPFQFRKLVQMHVEGDTIKLVYYRGGKKLTASVKLGKTNLAQAFGTEDGSLPVDLQLLLHQLDDFNGQVYGMGDSMAQRRPGQGQGEYRNPTRRERRGDGNRGCGTPVIRQK